MHLCSSLCLIAQYFMYISQHIILLVIILIISLYVIILVIILITFYVGMVILRRGLMVIKIYR